MNSTRRILAVLGAVSTLFLLGCLEHVDTECSGAAPLFCDGNEDDSGDACGEDEEGCRAVTRNVCGREAVRYCRETLDCPAIDDQCSEGTVACDPMEDGPNCEAQVRGSNGCEQTLYCTPAETCMAELACDADESLSGEPCEDGEQCRDITLCGETGYCRPAVACVAVPMCPEGYEETDEPCDDASPDCVIETLCETTIHCQPLFQCNGFPVCQEGYVESDEPCASSEPGCQVESECGHTIYCRDNVACDAVPFCDEGEIESQRPCAPNERACREERLCGESIYCRPAMARSADQRTLAGPCEPIEWPMDPFVMRQGDLEGDWLYLDVEYSGGCAEHVFNSCFDGGFLESNPVQAVITLSHNANNDVCEAIESETVAIDLSFIRSEYQRLYGVENGEVIIRVDGAGLQSFRYVF